MTDVSSAAFVHFLEGNCAAAEEGFKNSLAASERSYGSSHLCVAQSLADLAIFYCKVKKYNEVHVDTRPPLSVCGLGPAKCRMCV